MTESSMPIPNRVRQPLSHEPLTSLEKIHLNEIPQRYRFTLCFFLSPKYVVLRLINGSTKTHDVDWFYGLAKPQKGDLRLSALQQAMVLVTPLEPFIEGSLQTSRRIR
ncbi:hypothetical protein PoB_000531900 [Plakobranchus ocellatus]|uniref:Uncharacterized protein n=1 Tax=Plakobranchus ocellatus TaxID=259542 RepID=A0AAV3Y980_9GAST|nr:hypothetical protein PoB_000531900 [Plakobranchus ocellatus]